MKKLLYGICVMVLFCIPARAVIYVDWYSLWGNYYPDTATGILDPIGSGKSTIAQLIFSLDNTIDTVDISNVGGGYVSGDDLLFDQETLTEGVNTASQYADFSGPQYSNLTFTAGYIYGRMYQDATPAVGEFYYNGPIIGLTDVSTNPVWGTPQSYNMTTTPGTGDLLDQTIVAIPEPATMMLFGLGMVMLAGRKVLRKKK